MILMRFLRIVASCNLNDYDLLNTITRPLILVPGKSELETPTIQPLCCFLLIEDAQ